MAFWARTKGVLWAPGARTSRVEPTAGHPGALLHCGENEGAGRALLFSERVRGALCSWLLAASVVVDSMTCPVRRCCLRQSCVHLVLGGAERLSGDPRGCLPGPLASRPKPGAGGMRDWKRCRGFLLQVAALKSRSRAIAGESGRTDAIATFVRIQFQGTNSQRSAGLAGFPGVALFEQSPFSTGTGGTSELSNSTLNEPGMLVDFTHSVRLVPPCLLLRALAVCQLRLICGPAPLRCAR